MIHERFAGFSPRFPRAVMTAVAILAIATEIEEIVAGPSGDEYYVISGLPVVSDTLSEGMFMKMGIAASLAGLIIFQLMLLFCRSLALVPSPMGVGAHSPDEHFLASLPRVRGRGRSPVLSRSLLPR